MITGTPTSVANVKRFVANGRAQASHAQHTSASAVHQAMVELARRTPAWEGMEDGIKMQEGEDGSYTFGFDPNHPMAERATELEFGTPSSAPVSVFRKVLAGRRDGIERGMRAELRGWS